jgi:hypothetical protein
MLALPVVWADSFSMLLGCVALKDWRPGPAPVRAARMKGAIGSASEPESAIS